MIRFGPVARTDLRDIGLWIKDASGSATADRVIQSILQATRQLEHFPLLGRVGLVAATRELPVAGLPYIVVYKPEPDGVRVVRVIHGAMRWPSGA